MDPAFVSGIGSLPNGTYDAPERDLALDVISDAVADAALDMHDIDGVYLSKPRPWTPQKFFSTLLINHLGLAPDRVSETYTGGTTAGVALQSAVSDVRSGHVETALVLGVERNSIIDTDRYFEYILGIFDHEFHAPAGPSIPAVYAQSYQRYLYEHDVDREAVASIAVKNRENARTNPDAVFDEPVTVADVVASGVVAEPLRLFECPMPCDGAAALVVSRNPGDVGVPVSGIGYHHATSHLLGPRDRSITAFPALAAVHHALDAAALGVDDIDVIEPYTPFPHVEAIMTEALGLFDPGDGALACARGETGLDSDVPVSPSGGCIGRGHPPMVTPLLNHIEAVKQVRGTAANQIPDAATVLTTSEHGHLDGMTATVFGAEAA